MILIGQYDSSFVRRVGIAMTLYGIPFEHRPWSTFGEPEKIRPYNPLLRVPTLVLDDGDVLIESHIILDFVDSLVPAGRRMFPQQEPERHRALKVAALATGMADKTVSLYYETRYHRETSEAFVARARSQVGAALAALETDRASRKSTYWFGDAIDHADIAVACALRHMSEAIPDLFAFDEFPALAKHAQALEALPVFQEVSQPFFVPT